VLPFAKCPLHPTTSPCIVAVCRFFRRISHEFRRFSCTLIRLHDYAGLIDAKNVLIVYAEAGLPVGELAYAERGAARQHPLLSVAFDALGSDGFARMAIGVGGPILRPSRLTPVTLEGWTDAQLASLHLDNRVSEAERDTIDAKVAPAVERAMLRHLNVSL